MSYSSPFTGPFSPYPVPPGALKEIPDLDNVTDIGRATKRYKSINVVKIENKDEASIDLANGDITLLADEKSGYIVAEAPGGLILNGEPIPSPSVSSFISDSGLYPHPLQDAWTNASPTNQQSLILYAPEITTMLGTTTTNGISYSVDYGTTWTAASGLGAQIYTVGWSGSLFAAVAATGSAACYTSPDGITWTVRTPPPYLAVTDTTHIGHFNGLFICGTNNATNGIMTSPDGITWTARASSRKGYRFVDNGVICVATSDAGFLWSTDGTAWHNTVDSFACRAVTYSPERREFIAVSNTGTATYRSVDGVTWTAYSGNVPSGLINDIIWVPRYGRYYTATAHPTSTLYTLYSSSDGITPFIGNPNMTGATAVGSVFYTILYIDTLDRFYAISNSSPRIHYNTTSTTIALEAGMYTAGAVVPAITATHDLGTASLKFRNLYLSGSLTAAGVVGTTTNDTAAAGSVGEIITATTAGAVTLSDQTTVVLTSISLTAGCWDVNGSGFFATDAAATDAYMIQVAPSTSTSSVPAWPNSGAWGGGQQLGGQSYPNSAWLVFPTGTRRYTLAVTTTVYMLGFAGFSAGTITARGFIRATRVR